ncbi:MAG: hypothetical protein IIB13_04880 [Chloroflexi bacterium]|nr:hypothetical protein [Chloroflexota bacterium]
MGRTWDVSMLLSAVFAGAFGLWFPHWFETISTAASLWEVSAEVLPPAFADRIPMAFAAGFMVGRLRQLPDTECARLANRTAARFLEEKERLSR